MAVRLDVAQHRLGEAAVDVTLSRQLLHRLLVDQRTGGSAYAACFEQTLQWIVNKHADWEHGDWHATVSAGGHPGGDKAGAWKEPYHEGRALLSCLEMLDKRTPETLRY